MEDLKSWHYYLSYMNLLADVCRNKNRLALEFVNDHVPLNILCSLLEEHESSIEAHLKLLHYAYVEHTLYLSIRKIDKVK